MHSHEESESKKSKEPTPEELAAQKQKEADIKKAEEERRKTGAFWSQLDASIQYNLAHGWGKWEKIDETPDAPTGRDGYISSAPGEPSKLDEGLYALEGTDNKVRAHYRLDLETGAHTVTINLYDRSIGGNYSLQEPKTPSEFNTHAEMTARMSVKFLAGAGFSKVKITIPKDCAFRDDLKNDWGKGENWGSNTLKYQKLYLKSALDQCIRNGIGFDRSDPQVEKLLQIITNKSQNEGQEFEEMITKANAGGKARQAFNEFVNPKVLQGYRNQLSDAEKINQKEQEKITEEIKQAVKAKGEQVVKLEEQLKGTTSDPDLTNKLKAELAEAQNILQQQKALQAELPKVASSDELYDIQARFEQLKNPNQHLTDAIREVKEMLMKILPDKSPFNFTQADKDQLNKFKLDIEAIEKKLESPMNDAERAQAEKELKAAIEAVRKLTNPTFKKEADAVLDKADKLADGKKAEMATDKRFDDRVSRLEKAMESLEKAEDKYREVLGKPKMIVGMVKEKRLGKLVKLDEKDAAHYAEKQYKNLDKDRDGLKDAIKAEKAKLEAKANDLKKKSGATEADKTKAVEIKQRLLNVAARLDNLGKAPTATATTSTTPGLAKGGKVG